MFDRLKGAHRPAKLTASHGILHGQFQNALGGAEHVGREYYAAGIHNALAELSAATCATAQRLALLLRAHRALAPPRCCSPALHRRRWHLHADAALPAAGRAEWEEALRAGR